MTTYSNLAQALQDHTKSGARKAARLILAEFGGGGGVTVTGSPVSGNLTKFSGPASITNGDLSGDVTTAGTLATTIANNVVSYAKIQDVSVTDVVLGRKTAGSGDMEELSALPFGLTGDVTTSADSNATTIANDAVTYAKMQNVSALSKLLGRGDSGAGDPQEVTLGTNLSMVGTTLNVGADAVGGSMTPHGDSNYSILNTDRIVYLSAALTAFRTWTLPLANTVSAGVSISVIDLVGGITSANYILIARSGSDLFYPQGTSTSVPLRANDVTTGAGGGIGAGVQFTSDGVSKWY